MKEKKFSVEELKQAIHDKFSSLEELANKIGGTKQDISAKIRRQSPRFLNQLKSVGIVLPYKQENNISTVNESVVVYQASRIMQLEKENKELKEENAKLRMCSIPIIKKDKGASVK